MTNMRLIDSCGFVIALGDLNLNSATIYQLKFCIIK